MVEARCLRGEGESGISRDKAEVRWERTSDFGMLATRLKRVSVLAVQARSRIVDPPVSFE